MAEPNLEQPNPNKVLPTTTTNSMELQKAEFDAVAELAKQYRRITMTPIVDDDYPEVRHGYEGAVRGVIEAFKANGRI